MFPSASTLAAAACALLAGVGARLHLSAAWRLRRLMRGGDPSTGQPAPPLTHWRAIKRGVPRLAEKLEAFVQAGRAGDQFLIGADAGSVELAECEALRAKHPEREIAVVACESNRAANPKISKFIQMAPHARHAHWLLTDSEAALEAEFVEGFRQEWRARACAALTAGYRFAGAKSLIQGFDTAPALLTLWPGIMHVRRVDFTLGAATGVRAADIAALGGWEAFSRDLAEDRQVGARLTAAGKEVVLSRHVLSLEADQLSVGAWLKHQHRVAVTYRKATPLGALGLPVLHALPLAVAAALIGGSWWWLVPLAVYTVRLAAAVAMARLLRFRVPWLPLAVLVVPLLEGFFWLLAWLPLPVWWSGKWRRLK